MAVTIEVAETVTGQRETVCRKKDEYGDKIMDDSAGKVEISRVFAPLMLLGFFSAVMLMFCLGPLWRCFRTCCCKRKRSMMEENRLVVQSSPAAANDSGEDEDLRKLGQVGMEPMPQEPTPLAELPDAPATPPHQLMTLDSPTPEPSMPSQALSPLTLPPSPGSPSNEGASQAPRRKWQRPAGGKKQAWKDGVQ